MHVIAKGTKLQQTIASVLTDVAQVFSLSGPNEQPETFEFDTFDNSARGIPKKPTGRSDGGAYDFSLFLDPDLASHEALLAKIEAPAVTNWKIIFANAIEWTFAGTLKGPNAQIELADGVKADFSVEVDGASDYPTS